MKNIEEMIKNIEAKIEESEYANTGYAEYWYSWSVKHWEKGDKSRIYIGLKYGRKYKGKSKWQRGADFYVDTKTDKFYMSNTMYCNANEKHFIRQMLSDLGCIEA